jgi:hypothetical protein
VGVELDLDARRIGGMGYHCITAASVPREMATE